MVTVPTFWLCGSIVLGSPLAAQRRLRASAPEKSSATASAASQKLRIDVSPV